MKNYSKPESVQIDLATAGTTMLTLSLTEPSNPDLEIGGGDALSNRKGWSSEEWSDNSSYFE